MSIKNYEKQLIKRIIDYVIKTDKKELVLSIVLVGSIARKEGTYLIHADGSFQLKSDVEIVLVYKSFIQRRKINKIIKKVVSNFDENLNFIPIEEKRMKKIQNLNFSFFTPKYKTLFTYDLFNSGKTIYGIDFLKNRTVLLDMVDIYEAKRLVGNRIGEYVYLKRKKELDKFTEAQWKGKLVLAIGSAWLICEKIYNSSYSFQYKLMKNNKERINQVLGNDFWNVYDNVYKFLRKNSIEYDVNEEFLRNCVCYINNYFCDKKVGHCRVNNFSRIVKYYIKYFISIGEFKKFYFEEKIIESLIDGFASKQEDIDEFAYIWFKLLY